MEEGPLITTTTTNPNTCIITTITNSRQKALLDTGSIPSVYFTKYSLPRIAATATNESPEDNRTTRFINDLVQNRTRTPSTRPSHQTGTPLTTITDSPSLHQLHESYRSDASASNDIDDNIERRRHRRTSPSTSSSNKIRRTTAIADDHRRSSPTSTPILVPVINGQPLTTIIDSPSLHQLHESSAPRHRPTTTTSTDKNDHRRPIADHRRPTDKSNQGQEQPRTRKTRATIASKTGSLNPKQ